MYPEAGRALKRSDALLDHILSLRTQHHYAKWQLTYAGLLVTQMMTATDGDRAKLIAELADVLNVEG